MSSMRQSMGRSSALGEAEKRTPSTRPLPRICMQSQHQDRAHWANRLTIDTPACFSSAPGVKLVLDAEPFHAVTQRAERDAEQLRGGSTVVVGSIERIQNGLALHCVE